MLASLAATVAGRRQLREAHLPIEGSACSRP